MLNLKMLMYYQTYVIVFQIFFVQLEMKKLEGKRILVDVVDKPNNG